jgi:kynurenine formamidase
MSAEQFIFLNYPLSPGDPNPPAIPPMELKPFMSLENGDDANVTSIKLVSHTGTHMDAPCHVIAGGITVTDFKADEFIFQRPLVFDLPLHDDELVMPEHLQPLVEIGKDADLILFRFGYGSVRKAEPNRYSAHCPGFGVESAEFLRDHFPHLRAIGMDVPSLSCICYLEKTMRAHNVLLAGNGGRFIVVEDMNLNQDLAGLSRVTLAPWMIKNLDGGPVTIIGERIEFGGNQ